VLRILAGVDYSELGELALRTAVERARVEPGAELHVVTVGEGWAPATATEIAADVTADFVRKAEKTLREYVDGVARGVPSRVHVRTGKPSTEIAAVATEIAADLVVVGTHGRTGLRRMALGSVAEAVVRRAPCPVLVVRPTARELARARAGEGARRAPGA
jgi:nucleotide-binding universal stress UspA family protein